MINILIVDDSKAFSGYLSAILEKNGRVIDVINQPTSLIQYLESHATDIVLLDIYMPDVDGVTLLKQIRSNPNIKHIAVVIVSAIIDKEIVDDCIHYGVSGFIDKTNSQEYICGQITSILAGCKPLPLEDLSESLGGKRQSRRLYESIVNTSIDGIVSIDESQLITSFNPACERIFGYMESEVLGKNVKLLMPEDYSNSHDQYIENHKTTRINKIIGKGREVTGKRKNGSIFPMELAVGEIDAAKNRGYTGIVRDISDIVFAKKQLKESQKRRLQENKMESLGVFAGGIAHDFNNILSIISGNVEMAISNRGNPAALDKNHERISKASERAANLVKQLLAFGRPPSASLGSADLVQAVKEALEMTRPLIPSNIVVVEDYQEDCPSIMGDSTQLYQIIVNLLGNANQAIGRSGGSILLTVRGHRDKVSLCVQDSGSGIDEKDLERIFDPFYTKKRVNEGTGLGLSVVHGLVSSLQGKIEVESSLGKGSKFTICFLIAGKHEIIKKTVAPNSSKGAGNVLLVDDDPDVREISCDILEAAGYIVTSKENAKSALSLFKQAPYNFDIVLTDQTMPNMSGTELVEELVAIRPGLPVVLATGYALHDDEVPAVKHLVRLQKPIRRDVLLSTLSKILDGSLE